MTVRRSATYPSRVSRRLADDRLARFGHYLARIDFRAFNESVEGLQRSLLVVLRVDGLDAFDRGLERQRQASRLHKVYGRISSPGFSPKLDACELVNGIAQLRRIVFDGLDDAGNNHRKINLR